MKTKRVTLGMILGATVLAATAFTNVDAGPSTSYTAPVVDLPVKSWRSTCGFCYNCPAGNHQFAYFMGLGDDEAHGESTHGCRDEEWSEGWCPQAHGNCQSGFASLTDQEMDRLWAMVTKGTTPDLGAALAEFGEAVSYNATRGAVQVQGCDGMIIVNLPVSAAQVDRLSE